MRFVKAEKGSKDLMENSIRKLFHGTIAGMLKQTQQIMANRKAVAHTHTHTHSN